MQLVSIFCSGRKRKSSNGSYGGDEWSYSEEADISWSVKKQITAGTTISGDAQLSFFVSWFVFLTRLIERYPDVTSH